MRTARLIFALVPALLVLPLSTQAQGDDGKLLHDEHCVKCHGVEIYTREDRIVNNFRELAERVRQCELSNELIWFDEEINAVIDYLNAAYYKFEIE